MNFLTNSLIFGLFLGICAPAHGMWKTLFVQVVRHKKALFTKAALVGAAGGTVSAFKKDAIEQFKQKTFDAPGKKQSVLSQKLSTAFGHKKLIAHDFDAQLPDEIQNKVKQKVTRYYESEGSVAIELGEKPYNEWRVKKNRNEFFDRIHGAKRFADIINDHQYDEIVLPKKYSYTSSAGNQYIIAENMEEHDAPITLKQVKQLKGLVKISKWLDPSFSRRNFMRIKSGKIAIVDTDPFFEFDAENFSLVVKAFNLSHIKEPYDNMLMFFNELSGFSTPTAQLYIEKQLDHYRKLQTSPAYAQEHEQAQALRAVQKPLWQLLKLPFLAHT